MMISRSIFNDPHFQNHVHLSIIPSEKHGITKVQATIYSDSQNRSLDFHKVDKVHYKWWLTIPFYTESIDEALKEIKKDIYESQGYSEY